ncbi:MAG: hypothetical protein ABI131_04480 [Nostocoides sp.]
MGKMGQFYAWAVLFVIIQVGVRSHLHGGAALLFASAFGLTAGAVWQLTQRVDPVDRLSSLSLFFLGSAAVSGLATAVGSSRPWWSSADAVQVIALCLGMVAGVVFAEQALRRRERGRTTLDRVHADEPDVTV